MTSREASAGGASGKRGAAGPVQAVLFDLDGTLVATKRLYLEAYRRALQTHLGHLPTSEEIVALRPRAELKFLRDVVGPERYAACLAEFRRLYAELHATHFDGIYTGVLEMLVALRRSGLRLGIVTGKSRASWDITLRHVDLGAFDVAIFDEDVQNAKPAPDGLRLALERLGITPDRAAYVGDSVSDARAAGAAGIRPIAALWPKKPGELESFMSRVIAAGASLAPTPADVVTLVT